MGSDVQWLTNASTRIRRAREGDPEMYKGDWEVQGPPFDDREPEVLVSRSLRLSVDTYEQVRAVAAARAVSPSTLMRRWIEEGVAAERDEGATADPTLLVHRLEADIARLAHAIRHAA